MKMIDRLINFSDGVATQETQDKLNELYSQLTSEELTDVENFLYNLLGRISKKRNEKYRVDIVENIPLQIMLHDGKIEGQFQYGAHSPSHIKILKMSSVDPKKGKLGELIILAHEIGHAILGEKNYTVSQKKGTHIMEKMTDEMIKDKLWLKFPIFYSIYNLVRNTHHYKTKEGDYKEFFRDIIEVLEKEWESYKQGV